MNINEIKKVVSSWRQIVNRRFEEIEANPALIKDRLSFSLKTGLLTNKQFESIVDDPACSYKTQHQVEEFTIDDTLSKFIEANPIEESLESKNGHIYLVVDFCYRFYLYSKFNCCAEEIDCDEYEKLKFENDLPSDWNEVKYEEYCEKINNENAEPNYDF